MCSPYDHFPKMAERTVAIDLAEPTPKTNAVIFGGGKIVGGLSKCLGDEDFAARDRIAWGVSTVQSSRISLKYWRAFRTLTLVGTRDWGDERFDFAPCSTCMSPHFDRLQTEQHDVVLYLHHWKSAGQGVIRPDGIPVRENNDPSFKDVISFLASGRTVVSNSYHGVFWGLLLGKRVLSLPFSNKFSNYRIQPGVGDPKSWTDDLHKARGSDEMIGLCREASATFAKKVQTRIES